MGCPNHAELGFDAPAFDRFEVFLVTSLRAFSHVHSALVVEYDLAANVRGMATERVVKDKARSRLSGPCSARSPGPLGIAQR